MPIRYVLRENNLTDDPDDYMAKVQPGGTVDMEDIIREIGQRGSTVSEADLRAVYADTYAVVRRHLAEGDSVTMPLVYLQPSIRGRFHGPEDSFDPRRHRLLIRAKVSGRLLKEVRAAAQLVKGLPGDIVPSPRRYRDFESGAVNDVATPGGLAHVFGYRLKFDPTDPEQGIFFVAPDGQEVQVERVGQNENQELSFLVPQMPAGQYQLEVRAAIRGGAEVRRGALRYPLQVH